MSQRKCRNYLRSQKILYLITLGMAVSFYFACDGAHDTCADGGSEKNTIGHQIHVCLCPNSPTWHYILLLRSISCWSFFVNHSVLWFNYINHNIRCLCDGRGGVAVASVATAVDQFLFGKLNVQYFNFFNLVTRQSTALSTATQYVMPPEFGTKWGTECLDTRFPLPTLLFAGYSVKLI